MINPERDYFVDVFNRHKNKKDAIKEVLHTVGLSSLCSVKDYRKYIESEGYKEVDGKYVRPKSKKRIQIDIVIEDTIDFVIANGSYAKDAIRNFLLKDMYELHKEVDNISVRIIQVGYNMRIRAIDEHNSYSLGTIQGHGLIIPRVSYLLGEQLLRNSLYREDEFRLVAVIQNDEICDALKRLPKHLPDNCKLISTKLGSSKEEAETTMAQMNKLIKEELNDVL